MNGSLAGQVPLWMFTAMLHGVSSHVNMLMYAAPIWLGTHPRLCWRAMHCFGAC